MIRFDLCVICRLYFLDGEETLVRRRFIAGE